MSTELQFSEGVDPDYFEAMSGDQPVYATAIPNLDFADKTIIVNAKQRGNGLPPLEEAKMVAAELLKNMGAWRKVLSTQNPIANAQGIILHSNLHEINFVISKEGLMREVVGHPGIKSVTIEGIGAPALDGVRSHRDNQPIQPAGVA